jgi:hypothetical protein
MATKKSIEAARELIKKYRSITLEELEKIKCSKNIYFEYGRAKARKLTGFSSWDCQLCIAVRDDCSQCIYGESDGHGRSCYVSANKQTYFDIVNAKTDEELLIAIKNRADHIESILNKLEQGV